MARRRTRQPDPRTVQLAGEEHSDVFCFLDLLAEHFGCRADALAAALRVSPDFREWQRRVRFCQHCQRYIPTGRYNDPSTGKALYTGYAYHRVPNPGEPPPYLVQCPGATRHIDQGTGRRISPDQINRWRAKIRQIIKHVEPDLL